MLLIFYRVSLFSTFEVIEHDLNKFNFIDIDDPCNRKKLTSGNEVCWSLYFMFGLENENEVYIGKEPETVPFRARNTWFDILKIEL